MDARRGSCRNRLILVAALGGVPAFAPIAYVALSMSAPSGFGS
jgi:hypothetical protein